jgi:PEP-CTERM motif
VSRRLWISALAAVAVVGFSAARSTAAPIVVDTFITPGSPAIVGTGMPATGSFASTSGPGILGTRTLSYNGGLGNFGLFEGIAVGGGSLMLGTQSRGEEVVLNYGGFGSLNLSGSTFLQLTFVPIFDLGVGTFDIVLKLTTSTGLLSGTFTPPVGISPGGGILLLPLGALTGPGNLGIVTGIELRLNDGGTPSPAADFTLTGLAFTVPEPATLATFGFVGLLGGYAARRKLKAGAATPA